MGMAINDLTLVRCGKKFRLFSKKEIDKSKIDEYYNYSGICITKNGKLPIICFGTTGKISKTNASDGDFIYQQFAYSIRIHLDFDSNFQDNETDLCIDFTKFPFGAMEGRRNLSRLFIYTSNKRFNNICNILSTKSHMKKKRNIKIDNFYGMNNDQREAIKKSIETKNYSVISGYKSTGKTVVLTTLLNYFDGMNTRVLVVGPSDDSLDYLCMQIIDQIKFVRIITEVPSNPIIAKNSLAVITHDCKSSDEIINKLMNYHIYISSIFDVNDPCLGSSLYDVLIVEDCENIPIHLLLGPITRCNRYIFCGNLSNLTITHSIFSFIDMNSVFFLRTQYSKSYPIYCLENALIYNYSAKLENNSLNEKGFIPCLAMLNQFHEIHQKWITPLLSSSTFVLFSPESNENNNSFKMNALIIAMLTILLIIIGYQPDVIGILTYDKKEKKMIQKCIKHFLVSSSKWFENELSDYTSIKRLIQIHHFSIFRNKVDYQNKNPKILIVSFSTAQIIPANDAMISLVEAREKLYIIGNEKSLRSNPFFNKMINLIGNSIMFPTNIHDVDCTPFEGAAQIFRNLA
ncbi:hypothetical protein TRFO_41163 [Tritrichomonas foetus]|uniref:DNA replication ATP-dependent helicase/nuclease n=1 Tax=Tritrichomonas foetus TaxID=1144522 RepID=A0A1J4L1H3_9EUKA|nr:hypothetical protein TRFO_41163 [Tritrichomonas foetus]|eukprot:OHT17266.1 hypothetical protein TRFO_41163 [Tritrichomonas foetus]